MTDWADIEAHFIVDTFVVDQGADDLLRLQHRDWRCAAPAFEKGRKKGQD